MTSLQYLQLRTLTGFHFTHEWKHRLEIFLLTVCTKILYWFPLFSKCVLGHIIYKYIYNLKVSQFLNTKSFCSSGQMIAGDAPEMTENSGYLEESAHQFTEEKYINLPGGPDNTDHPYYDNNGAFVGGQDESKNGILDGPDDLDNPNDESKSGRLGDPEDPDNPYLDGSGSIQKLEISNLDAEEATQEQMTQDIQMIEGGQQGCRKLYSIFCLTSFFRLWYCHDFIQLFF